MLAFSDRQDASIKATSLNMIKAILPYLGSTDYGQHVRGILENELILHEIRSVNDRACPWAFLAATFVSLVTGYTIASW